MDGIIDGVLIFVLNILSSHFICELNAHRIYWQLYQKLRSLVTEKSRVLCALHTFGTCKELEEILYSAQVMNNCFPEVFLYM